MHRTTVASRRGVAGAWYQPNSAPASHWKVHGAPTPPPAPTLEGYWLIVHNPQLWGVASGSLSFHPAGELEFAGSVLQEGSLASVTASGSWEATGATTLHLALRDVDAEWEVVFDGGRAFFLEVGGGRWFSLMRPLPD